MLVDPPLPKQGVRLPRAHPDVLLISHSHPDHANFAVAGAETLVISGPGEFEIHDITIRGIPAFHDREGGMRLGRNTVFVLELEGMRIVHLGDIGSKRLAAGATPLEEELAPCDILFVPCGGKGVLGPNEAAELVRAVRPKIAIPMHAASFTPFATSLGMKLDRAERLTLRSSDLSKDGMRLVTLSAK